MTRARLRLEPGTLQARMTERTARALRRGALQSLPTAVEWIEQNGVRFLVRTPAALARKERAAQEQGRSATPSDPFLPYEPDLFVADISDSHVCLLNKFNVLDHHLLIVTRAFEDQEALLTRQDFEALGVCMAEFEGLAFYNAGRSAGASQRHKHLQLVPLPLAAQGPALPIEPVLESAVFRDGLGTIAQFPFIHALARLDPDRLRSPAQAGGIMLQRYRALLAAVGLHIDADGRPAPYNLLATRRWMLLVPRSQERFEGISINALGFAGALLVRDDQQLQRLKTRGPLTALQNVAVCPGGA